MGSRVASTAHVSESSTSTFVTPRLATKPSEAGGMIQKTTVVLPYAPASAVRIKAIWVEAFDA